MKRDSVFVAIAAAFLITGTADAQRVTVYFDHTPSPSAESQVRYQLATDNATTWHLGFPILLEAPQGGQACVLVGHANPILYKYSLNQQTVTVATPTDLPKFAAITKAFATMTSQGAFRLQPISLGLGDEKKEPPNDLPGYRKMVVSLDTMLQTMRALQFASDREPDFTNSINAMDEKYGEAKTLSELLDTGYASVRATMVQKSMAGATPSAGGKQTGHTGDADNTSIEDLDGQKLVKDAVWKGIEDLHSAFRNGGPKLKLLADSLCIPVGKERVEVTLAVDTALAFPKDQRPQRTTGKTLLKFTVDPVSQSNFEINLGPILSVLPSEKQQFSVKNGVVVAAPDRTPDAGVATFAMARTSSVGWLWGTIGIGTDLTQAVSTLFFGLATKLGASIVGPQMTLGAGLSLEKVPVGLTKGTVGQALPGDVSNLDNILDKKFRPALGIMFTLTGVSIGSGSGGGSVSPAQTK